MSPKIVVTTLVYALKAVSLVYDLITFIPYYIVQSPDKVLKESRRIKAVPVSGKPSDPWRSVDVPSSGLTTSMYPECKTLDDLFTRACKLYALKPCVGTREMLNEEEEPQPNGKLFKKLVFGNYQWETYEEVAKRIIHFGNGLIALNLKPRKNLVIFAETRAEWMIAAQTCFRYNFTIVTLYATLSDDAVIHGINETQAPGVFTSLELLPRLQKVLPRTPSVTHVIVMGGSTAQLAQMEIKAPEGITVMPMSDVENLGSEPEQSVMISHRNVISGLSGKIQRIPYLSAKAVYVGYLPLAHILELLLEILCLAVGARIGYSSPNTLTDNSSKIKRGSSGDVTVLKPTLITAVPVVMDRIYKNAWEKVNSSSLIKRVLFKLAYEYKLKHLLNGFDSPLCNRVIFKSTRDVLGGNVQWINCGGAPLSEAVQRFMNVCFCCPVVQGYGLTEVCGSGAISESNDMTTGRVGPPTTSNEILLRDWKEATPQTTNPTHKERFSLVEEMSLRDTTTTQKKTAEDFISIGGTRYFCTGDIGQFEEDGSLKIIDRKKDLVKLQHGEYISLTQTETVLKMFPLVEQICIVARSDKTNVVAFIVPNEANLKAVAKGHGIVNLDLKTLCKNKQVVRTVLQELTNHGLNAKLNRVELPINISLLPDPWLPDTGLVTGAFKLKRKVIEDRFKTEITAMYGF